MDGTTSPAVDLEKFSRAHRAAALETGSFEAQARDVLAAQDLDRRGVEDEVHALRVFARWALGKLVEGCQVAPLEPGVPVVQSLAHGLGKLRRVDDRVAGLQLAHLAQLDIGELGLDGGRAGRSRRRR